MPQPRTPRILDVGQCDLDHGNISRLLSSAFAATVERAATIDEAVQSVASGPFDLILVNRVLDATREEGLDLIRRLRSAEGKAVPVMLVSNYDDAQDAAVEAGAVPGFGKGALTDSRTVELLSVYLG